MPFPSSEEGLDSLLVIQPHLSWPGGAVGGELHPGTSSSTKERTGTAQTPGDSRRLPETIWPSTHLSSGMTAAQDWLLILGVLALQVIPCFTRQILAQIQKRSSITDTFSIECFSVC